MFGLDKKDVAICVTDGTFTYIEKSSTYNFQRPYSVHKGRPLVKPMMMAASEGYILSLLGPHLADGHNGYATIPEHMLKSNASVG